MGVKNSTQLLLVDAPADPRPATGAEIAELAEKFNLGSAVGRLRFLGTSDEEIRAVFEGAMAHHEDPIVVLTPGEGLGQS
jgi:hypothetical protein